jgi:phosphate acetyltransferase
MSEMQRLMEEVRGRSLKVVLPEGEDQRVIQAARCLRDDDLAEPIVLGRRQQVATTAAAAGTALDGIRIVQPEESDRLEAYAQAYAENRGFDQNAARRVVRRPLWYAGMMVSQGHADTMVAGVTKPTAHVIQAGVVTVGLAEGVDTPSSFFLMIVPECRGCEKRSFIYADCAVNIAPTPSELADIAIASEHSARGLLDEEPRVAMLSFSTKGSAAHAHVDRMTEALAVVKQRAGHLQVDGEFQVDAAIVPAVAAKKVKQPSPVVGRANVLIFPDLNSGNIAYKLTQYLAGAKAIGPLLQGFARPISDLSRGATVSDIVAATVICLAQVVRSGRVVQVKAPRRAYSQGPDTTQRGLGRRTGSTSTIKTR